MESDGRAAPLSHYVLLVGHTKYSPDWCFGLFKQRYRRCYVSSLHDVADAVNSSADVNTAQLVGTQEGEGGHCPCVRLVVFPQ